MTKMPLKTNELITLCPACQSANIDDLKSIQHFPAILFPIEKEKRDAVDCSLITSVLCEDCDHIFLKDIDKSFNEAIYKNYYYLYPFKGLESMQNSYRKPFENVADLYLRSTTNQTLLEIGCESYEQMKNFIDKGYLCTAINPGAKAHEKVKFIDGFYGTNKINGKFDVIISRFNLEHIIDCQKFFSELHQNITENGLVLIQVPNAEYFLSNKVLNILAHEHPHYFCQSSLKEMIRFYGFDLLHISSKDEASIICVLTPKKENSSYKPKAHIEICTQALHELKLLISNHPGNTILYGAGLSLTALLYEDNPLNKEALSKIKIVDDNPIIDGKYMPNTQLAINSLSKTVINRNDIIILMLNEQYQSTVLSKIHERECINKIYAIRQNGLVCLTEATS